MLLGFALRHWRWLAGAALAIALLGALYAFGERRYAAGAAGVQSQWAAERARQTAEALKASEAARAEEQRRAAAQQEVQRDAQLQVDQARADAAAARAAGGRLRDQLAAFRRAAGSNTAAPAGGAAAGDPLGVLADVLERADERAGDLAAYADAARIAGAACERSYDALRAVGLSKTTHFAPASPMRKGTMRGSSY